MNINYVEALIEEAEQADRVDPLTVIQLIRMLSAQRPSVPFDLEPEYPPTGAALYCTAAAEAERELRNRYDACRRWRSLCARVGKLRQP